MAGIENLGVIFVDPARTPNRTVGMLPHSGYATSLPFSRWPSKDTPSSGPSPSMQTSWRWNATRPFSPTRPCPSSARPRHGQCRGRSPVKTLIQMDGDEHKAHRGIVNDWFKPASVKQLQDQIDELARQASTGWLASAGNATSRATWPSISRCR